MNNYRVITWTDENYREVSRMGFHVSDLKEVLALPFPKGAVCRDPITELTDLKPGMPFYDGKRPVYDGECFQEFINQGERDCQIIAVDESTGAYLYEYDMPGGRTFLRNHRGVPVSRTKLSRRWHQLIEGVV
jgi:hypothetical protein